MTIFRTLKFMLTTNSVGQKMFSLSVFLLLAFGSVSSHAVTFKIATLSPEGTGWMKALRGAAKNIGERTDGAVKFKIYPGGVMGDDKAVLRKMRIGQLHGAALTSGGVMQPYPDIALYNLPLIFRNFAEADYVRHRMDAKLMAGLREKNLSASA
jgi:TRAP-type C4-dicarboxylate transport system substrate-binding protein